VGEKTFQGFDGTCATDLQDRHIDRSLTAVVVVSAVMVHNSFWKGNDVHRDNVLSNVLLGHHSSVENIVHFYSSIMTIYRAWEK
jgi:hypothetical protein